MPQATTRARSTNCLIDRPFFYYVTLQFSGSEARQELPQFKHYAESLHDFRSGLPENQDETKYWCCTRKNEAMADGIDVTSLSLLGRAKANDEDAWSQVVHLYGPLVQRWCRRSGLSDEDAADVFQETFKTVARHIADFIPGRSVASFRSWLKTIVRTRTIDHFRRSRRHLDAVGGTAAQALISAVPDPLAEEGDGEAQADNALIMHRAMEMIREEFDPRNWMAFEEVALKGRSASEVAKETGVAPQTVRQANYRIRRRLRLILEDLVE